MKDAVTAFDMKKEMHFADGGVITYGDALKQLGAVIQRPKFPSTALIETVTTALKNISTQLTEQKTLDAEDYKVITGFSVWASSIHNDTLVAPKGSAYPNNIIYDMLASLRRDKSPSSDDVLLRFFLEGVNARKISKGNTPGTDFIATTLEIDALAAVEISGGKLSENAKSFYQSYQSLANYVEPQRELENQATALKTNKFYAFLDQEKVFSFEKRRNNETAANHYLLDDAITKGAESLKRFEGSKEDIEQAVNQLYEVSKTAAETFTKANTGATKEAYALAAWDASEWLSKLYVALHIAANQDAKYTDAAVIFEKEPVLTDIIDRSRTGNFPAKERNEALQKVEVTQLFTQEKLAQSSAVTALKEKFTLIPKKESLELN